jgi:hypothetical protein
VESLNLVISFIWTFVIVISVGLFLTGTAYVEGIGGPFVASVFLFLVAIVSSVILLQTKKVSYIKTTIGIPTMFGGKPDPSPTKLSYFAKIIFFDFSLFFKSLLNP